MKRSTKPRASIIITTKNEEKYIEQCLKSLQCQTFKDFEIIVSDAESRDKTVRIAKKYADRVVVRKTNVSAGRNLGASFAKGDIRTINGLDTPLLVPDPFVSKGLYDVAYKQFMPRLGVV